MQDEYRQLNALVAQHCSSKAGRAGAGGYYVDGYAAMSIGNRGNEPNPVLFDPDGLHLSKDGYAVWEGMLKPVLSIIQ